MKGTRTFKPKPWTGKKRNRTTVSQLVSMRRQRQASVLSNYKNTKQEKKCADLVASPVIVNISTVGTFTLLNGIKEGTSFTQRVGRKISMKTLHYNAVITRSGANAITAEDYCRIIIVYDKQANGAAFVTNDLLQDFDTALGATNNALSGINMNNRDRFLILMDDRIYLPAIGLNGVNSTFTSVIPDPNLKDTFMINRFIKLNNMEVLFKSANNAIADIASGSLYCFTISQVAAGGAGGYNLSMSSRLRFFD